MMHYVSPKRLAIVFLLCAAGIGTIVYYTVPHMPPPQTDRSIAQVLVGSVPVAAEVAATEEKRQQGLSGRESLAEGEGMLFVFAENGPWGIWMKGMLFSIDILFIAESGEIITVVADASPDTYPAVFSPSKDARYVLELPAGFTKKHGIAEGDMVDVGL